MDRHLFDKSQCTTARNWRNKDILFLFRLSLFSKRSFKLVSIRKKVMFRFDVITNDGKKIIFSRTER